MRSNDFNVYADVDREAMHDHYNECPEPDDPSPEEYWEPEAKPFAPHPREVKIGWWAYVPPREGEPLCAKCATAAQCRRLGCKL